MCAPAALAASTFALSAGSTLLGASAQNKAARANTAAAKADEAQQLNTLSLRGVQEEQSATNATQAAYRKTVMDQSVASLAAAENGVTGNSVNALHAELENQRGIYDDSVAENLQNRLLQLNTEKQGVISRTQSRINSVQPANPFATGLKLAGAALSSITQFAAQQPAFGGGNPSGDLQLPPMILTPTNAPIGNGPMAPVSGPAPLNLKIHG